MPLHTRVVGGRPFSSAEIFSCLTSTHLISDDWESRRVIGAVGVLITELVITVLRVIRVKRRALLAVAPKEFVSISQGEDEFSPD